MSESEINKKHFEILNRLNSCNHKWFMMGHYEKEGEEIEFWFKCSICEMEVMTTEEVR